VRSRAAFAVLLAGLAAAGPADARAAWGPAFDVSPPGRALDSSAVVAAPADRFVVAWTSGSRVQARRVGGRRASRVLKLGSRGADVRLWPSANGSTVVTWSAAGGSIRLRAIAPDDRLGPAVTVTEPGDDSRDVVAVPRRDGSSTVAWIDRTGAQTAVVKARRVSAAGVAGPVSTLTAPDARADEIVGAPDIDDGAMLVWNTGGILFGRRVTPAGAPARPAFQVSGLGQTASTPQLATDGTGGATVVWTQATAPTSVQEVAVISDDKLSGLDQLSAPGVPSLAPRLAFRNLFGVVVWEARPTTGAVVVGVDADGARTTLSRPFAGSAALRPEAAIDAAGHGFAVWQRGRAVQVARFGHGLARRVATLSGASSRAGEPHIAATPRGRALAIWVRTTRSGRRLQAARYWHPLANRGTGR
jgi:hypothetical protein